MISAPSSISLADEGSVLEIRRDFGVGMITAFIRIEGKPFGLIANNPKHLGGAIDAPAGDKAARFMQLCDAFDIPIVSLCDTPGFMVGPEAEFAPPTGVNAVHSRIARAIIRSADGRRRVADHSRPERGASGSGGWRPRNPAG